MKGLCHNYQEGRGVSYRASHRKILSRGPLPMKASLGLTLFLISFIYDKPSLPMNGEISVSYLMEQPLFVNLDPPLHVN